MRDIKFQINKSRQLATTRCIWVRWRSTWLASIGLILVRLHLIAMAPIANGQLTGHATAPETGRATLPAGFHEINSGHHLTIVTDLPVDDEIRQMPILFDEAMKKWQEFFGVSSEETNQWHATMYLMVDRPRFRQAGLIPKDVPEFQHGWQSGDRLWVGEQPSPYYRRHLMLHEGTHWFMWRKYGRYHAPWLMEGLAEILGTHRIEDGHLSMGIIPHDKLEVPFWGRTSIIRDQIQSESAPGIESILRYDNSAHQNVDAYAWSWALVLFLTQHPETSSVFASLLKQEAMDSPALHRWLRERLHHKLPKLRAEWTAFVSELDYGYTSEPGMLLLSTETKPIDTSAHIDVYANRGWQSTGLTVLANQAIQVRAVGDFTVAQQPKPWVSGPDGVRLEYYRGQPLGKLVMAVVEPVEKEPPSTRRLNVLPIGSHAKIIAPNAGELFFRINEANGSLADNTGHLQVELSN